MEQIQSRRPSGISGNALWAWGLFFAIPGIFGRGILQSRILGIGILTGDQLLDMMNVSPSAMVYATLSLVLQAMETCAVPIFAFLLVEGVQHTKNLRRYLMRMVILAAVSEIPYNLAMKASLLDTSSRNPVFGLALCLMMLYFFQRLGTRDFRDTFIKGCVTAAAVLWSQMLSIDFGNALVILTAVLWLMRKWPTYRIFGGAAAAAVCTVISPFFLAAPMGFLAVHMYNGERETAGQTIRYLAYPSLLLLIAFIGALI